MPGTEYYYRVSAVGAQGAQSLGLTVGSSMNVTVSVDTQSPGSINGFVYSDPNDTGSITAQSPGIATTLTLTGTDSLGTITPIVVTSNPTTGAYGFTGLNPGTYTITATTPSGLIPGLENPTGASAPQVLSSGAILSSVNFGETSPASIGGVVFNDANNDGMQDNGETGVSGVTLSLTGTNDAGASVSALAHTNSNGAYDFTGLRPGTYSIMQSLGGDYIAGSISQGTPGGGTVTSSAITNVVLAPGASGANNNFADVTTPPLNVAANLVSQNVQVTWNETSTVVTSFVVQHSVNSGSWTTVATIGAGTESFTDTNTSSGNQYQYRVIADAPSGNSQPSQVVTAPSLNALRLRSIWSPRRSPIRRSTSPGSALEPARPRSAYIVPPTGEFRIICSRPCRRARTSGPICPATPVQPIRTN